MTTSFDLPTTIDVLRTIGDTSISNGAIFGLLEQSLSTRQIRSIINLGIMGFQPFYFEDIVQKIHNNIQWNQDNDQVSCGDNNKNEAKDKIRNKLQLGNAKFQENY